MATEPHSSNAQVRFVRELLIVPLSAMLLLFSSCGGSGNGGGGGGGGSQPTVTSVSVSCAASKVSVGSTDQCSGTVSGTNNPSQSVTWSVNNVAGGSSTVGTISASGLYTAPSTVPSPTAVSVTATSAADSTKSGNLSITLTLRIGITPAATTVQLFHSQQFSATVIGVANETVAWGVNGTAGGNSIVGTIDSNGLYTPPVSLPTPGNVSVTATSQADSTQTASANVTLAPDSTVPTVVSTSPLTGATSVPVQPSIQIVFNEGLDPTTITPSSFALVNGSSQQSVELGYNASNDTVTLAPVGLLTPGANYTVQVTQSLHDLGGNALASPYSFSFQVAAPPSLTGTASFPQGIDPTTTVVSSFRGQQSVPDSSGNFSASIGNSGTTLIGSSLPASASALLAVGVASTSLNGSSSVAVPGSKETLIAQGIKALSQPGKRTVFIKLHQITASGAAQNASADLVMNYETTAEAVLFYSPALMKSDPQVSSQILTDIAADPNTSVLATALAATWNEAHPMQDPTVSAAYENALQSVLRTVIAQEPALEQTQMANNLARGNASAMSATSDAQSNSGPQITPFSVCCVDMPPFTSEGSNYTSNFTVKFGRASGWFIRLAQMPASFNPSQLQPVNGSSTNPDSPDPVAGEDQKGAAPMWIPGNSVFQYGDLLGDIGNLVSNVASDISGVSPADSPDVTVPSTPAAYYLVRLYSGGTGDPDEMILVSGGSSSIYAGQQLWRSALIANYVTVSVDLLSATNLIPSDIVTCEATALIPEIPNIGSDVGFQNAGWNTFMLVSGDVWTSFADNFGSCFTSNALDNVFEMLGDASKLASVAGTIVDGLNSVSQASDAIQIVTESSFDPAVDTALIQVGSPATGSAASITVNPSSLNISAGASGNVAATAYDGSGNSISNAVFTWSIGNTSIATLSANGNEVQVTGVSPGTTQLTATAASGATGSITVTISASASLPSVGGVFPNPVPPSASAQTLTINGTNFVTGATVTYHDPQGNSYPGHATTFISASQLTDPAFNDANDGGTWTVTVVNPGSISSAAFSFTVSASNAAPTITSVSPSPLPGSNSAQALTINGTNFVAGATVTYHDPQGNSYPGHATTFVSASRLTDAAFNDASDAGTWTVTVVNPGGNSSTVFNFTVAATTPVLFVTPTNAIVSAAAGSADLSVINSGTGSLNYSSTVTSGTSWLTITSGASGGNNGTIVLSYAANTGAQRSGTIQINANGASGSPASVTVTQAGIATSNVRISENSGFDLEFAPPESAMATWLQSSPYRDIGVYIGGCNVTAVPASGPNGCGTNPPNAGTKQTNTNLNATWVSDVSNMGWGIMPLWVGPQASCISGNASSFYLIDTSTSSSAYYEGVSEADSAAVAANALGMNSSIVYYDMEAYSTSNSSCSATVGQFLSGWVNGLHAEGFQAGVYGAPYNAGDWSNSPDAIWAFYPDGVSTASDLNGVLSGTWAERRIHQYCAGGSIQPCSSPAQQTWGGVTLGTSPNQGIDLDVEDGPVFSLTVSSAAPTVTSVSPSPVSGSTSAQTLTINGSNFVTGATVTYHDPQGNSYPGHATTFVSASQLTDAAFNDANDGGTWTVTVVNPGSVSSAAFNFTVSASGTTPTITSVSPSPVPGSTSAQTLTINGSNFVTGATVTYHDPQGNSYPGHATTFVSASQLKDTAFNDANDGGTWTVTVVNPSGGSSTAFNFTVN